MATTGLNTPSATGGTTTGLGSSSQYGRLVITVVSAHNLKDKAWIGKSDPYCTIKLADAEIATRHVKNAGEACQWDESFSFNNVSPDDTVTFIVRDQNRLIKDAVMGEGSISLRQVFEERDAEMRVPLTNHAGTKEAGEVWIRMRREDGASTGTTDRGTTGQDYSNRATTGSTGTGVGYGSGIATGAAADRGVGAGYGADPGVADHGGHSTGAYDQREDALERGGRRDADIGLGATPAIAHEGRGVGVPVGASAGDVNVLAEGRVETCGKEYFTKVEDRPVVKERVTRVREHHPVEKEFVVETRSTGQERETGERTQEHMGAREKVVEVAQPVVEEPTNEYFSRVEDRPVMKERTSRTREHHNVEKEFVVETRATGQERETGNRTQDHVGSTERIVEVAQPKAPCE